jgi:hypothetical protein
MCLCRPYLGAGCRYSLGLLRPCSLAAPRRCSASQQAPSASRRTKTGKILCCANNYCDGTCTKPSSLKKSRQRWQTAGQTTMWRRLIEPGARKDTFCTKLRHCRYAPAVATHAGRSHVRCGVRARRTHACSPNRTPMSCLGSRTCAVAYACLCTPWLHTQMC